MNRACLGALVNLPLIFRNFSHVFCMGVSLDKLETYFLHEIILPWMTSFRNRAESLLYKGFRVSNSSATLTNFKTVVSFHLRLLFKVRNLLLRVSSRLPIECFQCINSERVSDHQGTFCLFGWGTEKGMDFVAAL